MKLQSTLRFAREDAMLAFIETLMAEALVFSPEYLMIIGLPELPKLNRPRFIIIRQPEPQHG
jgi:hypothetical protein